MSAPDYFPLKKNWRYTYNFTSSDFAGTAAVHIDILDVKDDGAKTTANARMTFILRDTHITRFEIINDGEWLYSTNGIVTGGRKEFPLPPEAGKKWTESPDFCRIQSLDGTCETPAGKFDGCMKVSTLIAEGDGGSAERWYAPGTGLVREEYNAEDKQCSLILAASMPLPKDSIL